MATDLYGIVANVVETDKVLRKGAKVWLLAGWSGGGFERVFVRGASRGSRVIEKYVPITRLGNFRAAWIHSNNILKANPFFYGEKEKMAETAAGLGRLADEQRALHPNRREVTQSPEAKITPEEMIEMFGATLPIEAVNLLWDSPDSMTIGEVRAQLRRIAEEQPKTVVSGETAKLLSETTRADYPDVRCALCGQTHMEHDRRQFGFFNIYVCADPKGGVFTHRAADVRLNAGKATKI